MSLMMLFFMLQTICTVHFRINRSKSTVHTVIVFIFLLVFTLLIMMYMLEILLYNICVKGFNIFNFTILLVLIFNQYVNPIALTPHTADVVEMKNHTLEETAAIFDSEDTTNKMAGAVATHAGVAHDLGDKKLHEEHDKKVLNVS
ncbi:hypothetical protein B0H10DRAFT_2212971 [Mycena sp. CBHHK59/15]|nr:hypothetical protein B0H10DRAFT_2212971 [Mycena sp. CBHHK59/15]